MDTKKQRNRHEAAHGGEAKTTRTFLSGVGVLGIATLLSKVIGLFYRIPLLSAVGIGGMAYFLAANHIYVTLYLIASAGLPLAVSILVAERIAHDDRAGAKRVYCVSERMFLAFGVFGAFGLFFGAPVIAAKIGLRGAELSLRVIAPTLCFSCHSAAIRGYFQGHQRMTETAISEVIESGAKLCFGLGLAYLADALGYDRAGAAAFATAGLTVGAFLSMLYLVFQKRRFDRAFQKTDSAFFCEGKSEQGTPLSRLFRIAAPVTLSAVVLSIASVVDTALISRRLMDAGFSLGAAETMYSSYGNLALPLYNLPASLITPVSLALVPLLSSAFRSGDRIGERTVISAAMRLCALLAIPASIGLSVFAEPILSLLYPAQDKAVAIAAPLLSVLALSVLFSCLMTVTNAILSAYGHPGKALVSMSIGALLKIVLAYLLVGAPSTNIYGAPLSTFFCNLAVTSLNLFFVCRSRPGKESVTSVFGRPLIASIPAMLASGVLYAALTAVHTSSTVSVLLSLAVAPIVYLLAAVRTRALRKEDISALPMGKRLERILFFKHSKEKNGHPLPEK